MYAERAYLPGPGRERECDSERCRIDVCAAKHAARRQSWGKLFSRWAVDHPATALPAAKCRVESATGSHVGRAADVVRNPKGTCSVSPPLP